MFNVDILTSPRQSNSGRVCRDPHVGECILSHCMSQLYTVQLYGTVMECYKSIKKLLRSFMEHYGSITESLRNVAEHYGTVTKGHCGALQSTAGLQETLQDVTELLWSVTEPLWNVVGRYGAITRRD